MRITKEHDERKTEILNTAERLFFTKGFDACTINDILKEIGIAKGTFYHYFTSKNEVLDAIVDRYTQTIMVRVNQVIENQSMQPVEKLMNAFMAMKMEGQMEDYLIEEMHKVDNMVLHQRTLSQVIKFMAPALATIVEEGIKDNVWKCSYPLQYMQIFLASAVTLTDEGIFEVDESQQMQMMVALITTLERMLEVQEGMFLELFMQQEGKGGHDETI